MHPSAMLLALSLAYSTAQAEPAETCEIDLGGPTLQAYFCAERQAKEASERLSSELAATLAALPVRLEQGGPAVTRSALRNAQTKWLAHINAHCRFNAQVAGEPGDWHIREISVSACMSREMRVRANQLAVWRGCFTEGGGQCMP